jgi:putative membrane protein
MSDYLLNNGLPAFISHFFAAVLLLAVFITIYVRITPYREITLIREGNVAAAASLSGAFIGYTLALASAISNSLGLIDMLIWGGIALIVQLLAFTVCRFVLPELISDIPQNKLASGVFLGGVSISLGLLNAACLTY